MITDKINWFFREIVFAFAASSEQLLNDFGLWVGYGLERANMRRHLAPPNVEFDALKIRH